MYLHVNRKLMDIMIQSLDVERFEQFCGILDKVSDYGSIVNSMREQLAVYSCEHNIEEKVKLKTLIPMLENDDVLTHSEARELLENGEPEKMLLSYLHHKDADKCLSFVNCLRKDEQHDLVRTIKQKANLNAKKKLPFKPRDSGTFSVTPTSVYTPTPTYTPVNTTTPVQASDVTDDFSRLSIVKEEGPDFNDIVGIINNELDEQYRDELRRLERHYEEMQLILEGKKNEAQSLLSQLYWRQKDDFKKDVKRRVRHGQRDQILSRPDAYMKVMTDNSVIDQIKGWDIPLILGSAHYSTTTAQGLGIQLAYTNKTAIFTVEFRDIQNRPLIAKCMEDMMDLTSNFDCVVIDSESSIVPNKQQILPSPAWVRGKMSIAYVPTVTGYLDISVKCSGHQITGSPFRVFVYPLCEYYKLLTTPQEILNIPETITGLTLTTSGDAAICTENGKLYIVKHSAGKYWFIDVAAYHGGLLLNLPRGISCDSNDNLVVANTRNSQLIKASCPEVQPRFLASRALKFEPTCVAAHDRIVAAGGSRDVVICNHKLDVLHTVTFSSSPSALTITNNLNIHVAVSESFDNGHYNYACIENIDSKNFQTRYAHLAPAKTTSHNYRINHIVTDEELNIIVCYTAQPVVAMFNSNGELLSCYENWGSGWSTEFATVAISQNSGGLLLVDQTKNKLYESHLDQTLVTYATSLVETHYV